MGTLATHKDVRAYPCRTLEKAQALAARFVAGVTKPARRQAPGGQSGSDQPAPEPAAAQPVAA